MPDVLRAIRLAYYRLRYRKEIATYAAAEERRILYGTGDGDPIGILRVTDV